MRKRAEQVDETRQRIVEAAVHLHGTVGPAETTIAGIAREAGVTRLTVYRHFAGDEAIFAACSAHWLSGQVPPNPTAWAAVDDPAERIRVGLADLYRFYRDGEPMLTRVYRDKASIAPGRRQQLDDRRLHPRRPAGTLPRRPRPPPARRRAGPRGVLLDVAVPVRRERPVGPRRRRGDDGARGRDRVTARISRAGCR